MIDINKIILEEIEKSSDLVKTVIKSYESKIKELEAEVKRLSTQTRIVESSTLGIDTIDKLNKLEEINKENKTCKILFDSTFTVSDSVKDNINRAIHDTLRFLYGNKILLSKPYGNEIEGKLIKEGNYYKLVNEEKDYQIYLNVDKILAIDEFRYYGAEVPDKLTENDILNSI